MIKKINDIFISKYSDCMDKLRDISYDSENHECLCDLDDYFLNYDKIIRTNYGSNPPLSPDAIRFKSDEIIFIEFKNGVIGNPKDKMQIKLKAIEGAYIGLFDIVSKEDSSVIFKDICQIQKSYIVVYNSKKNGDENPRVHGIMKHLGTRFGLDRYNSTFFRKILTVSDKVFIDRLNEYCSMH